MATDTTRSEPATDRAGGRRLPKGLRRGGRHRPPPASAPHTGPEALVPRAAAMFDDNKKIGMGLLGLSFLFISLGVLFLLDSTLIAIGALA